MAIAKTTATPAAPKFKFPKAMGACADKLYELRIKRLDMQKAVDAVEAEEKALKEHIIQNLPKSEASGVAGKLARVTVVSKEVPQVEDWDAFWAKFDKKKDRDLLQKRLNVAAVEARIEHGVTVPGVKIFIATSVSINKV